MRTSSLSGAIPAIEDGTSGPNSGTSFDSTAHLIINEVLPAPKNRFSKEWVELLNLDQRSHQLAGWMIDDDEGGSSPIKLGPEHVIEAGGLLVIELKNNILNNSGDTVRLLYPDGSLAASYSFGAAKADQSFIRLQPDSDEWEATDQPSPALPNRTVSPENEVVAETARVELEVSNAEQPAEQANQPAKLKTVPVPDPKTGSLNDPDAFSHAVKHTLYLSVVVHEYTSAPFYYAGPKVGEVYGGLASPTPSPSATPPPSSEGLIGSLSQHASNDLDMGMPAPIERRWQWITLLIGLVVLAGSGLLYFMHSVVISEDQLLYRIASENDGMQTDQDIEDLEGINFDEEFRQFLAKKPSQEA